MHNTLQFGKKNCFCDMEAKPTFISAGAHIVSNVHPLLLWIDCERLLVDASFGRCSSNEIIQVNKT